MTCGTYIVDVKNLPVWATPQVLRRIEDAVSWYDPDWTSYSEIAKEIILIVDEHLKEIHK